MGSGSSVEERQIDQLLSSKNPNINELAYRLPKNQEIRVKKIYHVNRQETEPVKPIEVKPVKIVKVIQSSFPQPPPAPPTVAYRPPIVVKDPNASAIRISLSKPVRN
ncbi:hypothetical protein BpHYR1_003776 [Brachionus plicatilis]|uniref:Uncharacterized protein n=1 Tax=Brachionus plicatilis TaxID=10195 RepID=A0A3M7RSD7_BRAPC|nr:hypothetical protein BpHYR1_003776 [Brachionus plicatilis]